MENNSKKTCPPENKHIRVLVVEDSQNDADLAIRELKRGGFEPKWIRVESASGMEEALSSEKWDIVISDFKMPHFTGTEALSILQRRNLDIPFIIVSGTIGEETAVSSMKAGASDYIMKDNMARLSSAVERELREMEVRKSRRKADEQLRISNEWLKLALNAAKSGIWDWDIATGKLYWSEEFKILFELPEDTEASFESWKKILHPEDIESAMDRINQAIDEKITLENEFRIILPSGKIKWVGALGDTTYDKSGKPLRMSGICMDITERKKAEEKLRKSIDEIKDLYNNAPCGYHSLDKDGMIIQMNDTELKWLGYSREEIIGKKKFTYLIPMEDVNVFNSTFPELKKRGYLNDIEGFMVRKDGSKFPVLINASVIKDEKGNFICSRSSVFDISDRKIVEQSIREKEYLLSESQRIAHVGTWSLQIGEEDKIKWTDETYRIYGVDQTKFIPTVENLINLIHPEDRSSMQEWIRACIANEHPSELEFRIILPDGKIRILSGRGDIQVDSHGSSKRIMGTVQNITERKEAEKLLRETNEFNESLINTIPFGLGIVDMDGNILFTNPLMEKVLGKNVIGEKCWNVYKDSKKQCVGCPLKKQIGTGETRKIEVSGVLGGRIFEITHTGMYYHGMRAVLEVFNDITERVQLEERLRQSEKMEAIGQLAGGIAHDFNNQLAGIMGYAEMIAERLDDKLLREYAENILRTTKRASDLTRDLLAFSRKGKMLSVPVNMHKTIEEVVSILEHSIDKKIEIKRVFKANPATVMGDPSQLLNTLLNIAINARDAMPDGGELTFTTENIKIKDSPLKIDEDLKISNCLKISISDKGIGMDEDTLKHIFEPFFTTKEVGKGTGMGLASVYGTVHNHHGVIKVDSKRGEGSVFYLYFPIIEDKKEFEVKTSTKMPEVMEATIMLIEDEEIISSMLVKVLSKFGHRIIVCNNGLEAAEMYKKTWKDIDVVILDIIMPKMNGKETFVALKKINPDVKVIVSSGFSIDGQAQEILDMGAKEFVQKPFNIKELLKAIQNTFKGKD